MRGVKDFPGTCAEIVEMIGVDYFIRKSTVYQLKIPRSLQITSLVLKK
jgi:hypothetical protein